MEDLIINAHILFDEHEAHHEHHEPPLPPTPAGEPVPHYAYGSKRTKVASVPPTPTRPEMPPPEDFTPRLPPRPANSIHPSLRANPPTPPTRERANVPPPFPAAKPDNDTPPSPSVISRDEAEESRTDEVDPVADVAAISHNAGSPSSESPGSGTSASGNESRQDLP